MIRLITRPKKISIVDEAQERLCIITPMRSQQREKDFVQIVGGGIEHVLALLVVLREPVPAQGSELLYSPFDERPVAVDPGVVSGVEGKFVHLIVDPEMFHEHDLDQAVVTWPDSRKMALVPRTATSTTTRSP